MQESLVRLFSQISSPWLDALFTAFTLLGEQEVLLGLFTLVYWNVSQRSGLVFGMTYLSSAAVNQVLKLVFASPRPYQVLPDIVGKHLETATGSSFPSGHTQGAASAYTTLGLVVRKPWFWAVAVTAMVLVAVSRVYLGVHWPVDVAAGLVLGAGMSFAVWALCGWAWQNPVRLTTFLAGWLAFLALAAAAAGMAELQGLLMADNLAELWKVCGVTFGAFGGFLWQDRRWPVSTDGSRTQKTLRWAVGLATSLGLLAGLKALLPHEPWADLVRYLLVGVWVTGLYPRLGTFAGLFRKRSSP